jgi:hypothetical protein
LVCRAAAARHPASLFIASHNYLAPLAKGANQDWHIIAGERGLGQRRQGDASILMQYLDATDSADYHRWVKWSEDHPERAALLWPAVQRLARRELYVFVPDLFDLAQAVEDPAALRQGLDQAVADKLLVLARRLIARSDRAAARDCLSEAAELDPTDAEIAQARAELDE